MRIDFTKYIPTDHDAAKDSFLRFTSCMTQESIPVRYGIDANLSVDWAIQHALDSMDKMFIFVIGNHGAEGKLGLAQARMFQQHFAKRLSPDTGHAFFFTNPYGLKHCTRSNGRNVDLNRAYVSNPSELGKIPHNLEEALVGSQSLIEPSSPRGNNTIANMKFLARFVDAYISFGNDVFRAGSLGQNKFPKGIMYCGDGKELEQEVIAFQRFLPMATRDYRQAVIVDAHTGLGPRGELTPYTEHHVDSPEYQTLSRLNPSMISDKDPDKKEVYAVAGTLESYAAEHSLAEDTAAMTLESGTEGLVSLGMKLYAENQERFFGNGSNSDVLDEAFCPSDRNWRHSVMNQSYSFFDGLVNGLNKI